MALTCPPGHTWRLLPDHEPWAETWVRTLQSARLPGTGVVLVWVNEQLRPCGWAPVFHMRAPRPGTVWVLVIGSPFFQVWSEVNQAVLDYENRESTPKLAKLLKLLLWAQNELDQKKVKYPKMTDLSKGVIEEPK